MRTKLFALLELAGTLVGYLALAMLVLTFMPGTPGMIVLNGLLIAALLALRARARKKGVPRTRPGGGELRDLSGRQWLIALGGVLGIWASGQIISQWIQLSTDIGPAPANLGSDTGWVGLLLALALAVLYAPVGEETLMRAIAYVRMRRAFGVLASALLTGGTFALLHGNLVQIVLTLPLGILLAMAMEASGRLRVCVMLHVIFNLLSVLGPAGLVRAAAGEGWIVLLCIPILLVITAAAVKGLLAPAEQPDRNRTGV